MFEFVVQDSNAAVFASDNNIQVRRNCQASTLAVIGQELLLTCWFFSRLQRLAVIVQVYDLKLLMFLQVPDPEGAIVGTSDVVVVPVHGQAPDLVGDEIGGKVAAHVMS